MTYKTNRARGSIVSFGDSQLTLSDLGILKLNRQDFTIERAYFDAGVGYANFNIDNEENMFDENLKTYAHLSINTGPSSTAWYRIVPNVPIIANGVFLLVDNESDVPPVYAQYQDGTIEELSYSEVSTSSAEWIYHGKTLYIYTFSKSDKVVNIYFKVGATSTFSADIYAFYIYVIANSSLSNIETNTTGLATESTLTSIDGKVATETTLSSIDGKVSTEAKQDTVIDRLTYDVSKKTYNAGITFNSSSETQIADWDITDTMENRGENLYLHIDYYHLTGSITPPTNIKVKIEAIDNDGNTQYLEPIYATVPARYMRLDSPTGSYFDPFVFSFDPRKVPRFALKYPLPHAINHINLYVQSDSSDLNGHLYCYLEVE